MTLRLPPPTAADLRRRAVEAAEHANRFASAVEAARKRYDALRAAAAPLADLQRANRYWGAAAERAADADDRARTAARIADEAEEEAAILRADARAIQDWAEVQRGECR